MKTPFQPLFELRTAIYKYIDATTSNGNKSFEKVMVAIANFEDQLADLMMSSKPAEIHKRYIHIIQDQLRIIFDQIPFAWMEKLEFPTPPEPVNLPTRKAYICYELYRILRNMPVQYPDYFNESALAPMIYIEIEKVHNTHKKMLVLPWLEEITKGYEEFYHIISQYLKQIWNQSTYTLTYQQINYAWNLISQLYYQWQLNHDASIVQLHVLMVCLNFNDLAMFTYLTDSISKDLEELTQDEEKQALLQLEQKNLLKIAERKNEILDPGFPSLKEMLHNWLKAERSQLA